MPTKTCALVERLQTIADPRRQGENLKHPLVDIIILGFCGVLAGCEDFVEIAEWAKEHEAVFSTFLELPHGSPSHDTFNRVFAMLHASTLQAVLLGIIEGSPLLQVCPGQGEFSKEEQGWPQCMVPFYQERGVLYALRYVEKLLPKFPGCQ